MTDFQLPPSYVGVAVTATTATVATITPLLSADGGGLLAHRVDPAASIPRGVADRRRLSVERALDLGGRIAAQIASRPVPPASVMILDPHEAVARKGMSPIQLLDTAGVTAVGIALAAALAGHGIDVAVTDRRTVEGALHGDARAARDSLTAHRVLMYGALAAGSGGQAGVALDLATLGAYAAGALDTARWALLSTEPLPGFEGVEASAAPAPEAGDSTPAAQPTEPAPEAQPEAEESVRDRAAALIEKGGLDRAKIEAAAARLDGEALDAALTQAATSGRNGAILVAVQRLGEGALPDAASHIAALALAAVGTSREGAIRAALGL